MNGQEEEGGDGDEKKKISEGNLTRFYAEKEEGEGETG